MSLLLDHNIPRKYTRLLQEWGYESSFLDEHTAADADDADVIALAQKLDAVLLTADLDFANILDYPPADYAGIIVLGGLVDQADDDDEGPVVPQGIAEGEQPGEEGEHSVSAPS